MIRRKRRTDGLCPICQKVPKPQGYSYCKACDKIYRKALRNQHNQANETEYQKLKRQGICIDCQQNPVSGGTGYYMIRCKECARILKRRYYKFRKRGLSNAKKTMEYAYSSCM